MSPTASLSDDYRTRQKRIQHEKLREFNTDHPLHSPSSCAFADPKFAVLMSSSTGHLFIRYQEIAESFFSGAPSFVGFVPMSPSPNLFFCYFFLYTIFPFPSLLLYLSESKFGPSKAIDFSSFPCHFHYPLLIVSTTHPFLCSFT